MIAPTRAHAGSGETRTRILTAAREIFESHGTRGTTTREVAERAGVNEATLFRHFGSKAALLSAMREHACSVEVLREIMTTLSGEDVRADLQRVAATAVERMHGQRQLMCISIAEESEALENAPEWRAPDHILALLTDYFARRVGEGRLAGDPQFLAQTFMGMMFQYIVARRLWRSHTIDRTTVDRLVEVFLNGVQR
jgi:AcrR family transcriptional regulator